MEECNFMMEHQARMEEFKFRIEHQIFSGGLKPQILQFLYLGPGQPGQDRNIGPSSTKTCF